MYTVEYLDHFLFALTSQNPAMPWTPELLDQISYDLLTNKTLYISGASEAKRLHLYRLPHELVLLPWIKHINLAYTLLDEYPKVLFHLPELETLILRGTLIRDIPEQLGELQALCHLDLSYMSVAELPQVLGSLSNLQTLSFTHSYVKELPDSIQALRNLRILDVSGSHSIRHIPDLFGGLESLEVLKLYGRTIEGYSPALATCRKLRFLSFDGASIKTIPSAVFELPHLEELILAREIEAIPPAIKQLQALRKLVIYTDNLTELPNEIGELPNLEHLELHGWSSIELPASLGQLPKLKHLDVRQAGLNKAGFKLDTLLANLPSTLEYLALTGAWYEPLRTSLPHLTNLKTLIWRQSELTQWPAELAHLLQLQFLELNGNFATIPSTIQQLKQLENLSLSSSTLEFLPAELGELTHLRSLSIGGGQLRTLPVELGKLAQLEQLAIWQREHPLEYLPPEICALPHLRYLRIDLRYLPPEIGNLTQLEELRCEGIESIPAELGQLMKLRKLSLRSPSLTELPPTIGQLVQLQILHLDHTNLQQLPPEIGNLASLRTLSLHRTPLQSLPPEIGNLHNLQVLDLGYTAIQALPATIGQLKSLDYLTIPDDDAITLPREILELKQLRTIYRPSTMMLMNRPFNTEQIFAHDFADQINSFEQLWQRYLERNPDLPIAEAEYAHTRLRPAAEAALIAAFHPNSHCLIQGPLCDADYAQALAYSIEIFAPSNAYRIVVCAGDIGLIRHFLSTSGWYLIHTPATCILDSGWQMVIAVSDASDAVLLHLIMLEDTDILNNDQLMLRSHGVILPFTKVAQQMSLAEQLSPHFALLARLQRWKIALEDCPIIWMNVDAHNPDGLPNEWIEAEYSYLFKTLPVPRFWSGLIVPFPNYGIDVREALDYLLEQMKSNGGSMLGELRAKY